MDLNELNPFIRRAMPCIMSENDYIARRIIYDYEIIYIEDGSFLFSYDDKEYICEKGALIFIRPGIPHAFIKIIKELHQPHIHFDMIYSFDSEIIPISFKNYDSMNETERNQIRKDIFSSYPKKPFININDMEKFLSLFYEIISPKQNDYLVKKAKLIELLSLIIMDNFSDGFTKPNKYSVEQQIKDYIDSGHGMTFTLDDFEKFFSYNKFHLEKLFRNKYGVSLISYRNAKRMELAKKLLLTMSVSKVSNKLGFSSIYSFSRAYKLHFGYSPKKTNNKI